MKGIVKKIIVLTLCMALVMGSFQMNVMAKRIPKPKLNKKNITIMMGKTSRLKLKNNKKKVKWRSLNKKIATVTKKGLVKGKSEGKTTIVAKVGKKKYKCKVRVRDPKKIYVDVKFDRKNKWEFTKEEVNWVDNVLTRQEIVTAKFIVTDMKAQVVKKENGKYDIIVDYTIKRTYDYYGKKHGSAFRIGIHLNRNKITQEGIVTTPIEHCKTSQRYKNQEIFEDVDLKAGQYQIEITGAYWALEQSLL